MELTRNDIDDWQEQSSRHPHHSHSHSHSNHPQHHPHRSGYPQPIDLHRERWRWLLRGRLQGASVALLAFVFWRAALIIGLTLFVLRAFFWSGRRYMQRRRARIFASHQATHNPHQHDEHHPHAHTSEQDPFAQTMDATPSLPDPLQNSRQELDAFDRRLRAATLAEESHTRRHQNPNKTQRGAMSF
jgi:hypothetical protein